MNKLYCLTLDLRRQRKQPVINMMCLHDDLVSVSVAYFMDVCVSLLISCRCGAGGFWRWRWREVGGVRHGGWWMCSVFLMNELVWHHWAVKVCGEKPPPAEWVMYGQGRTRPLGVLLQPTLQLTFDLLIKQIIDSTNRTLCSEFTACTLQHHVTNLTYSALFDSLEPFSLAVLSLLTNIQFNVLELQNYFNNFFKFQQNTNYNWTYLNQIAFDAPVWLGCTQAIRKLHFQLEHHWFDYSIHMIQQTKISLPFPLSWLKTCDIEWL